MHPLRILMYSQGSHGLGNACCTLTIATHLSKKFPTSSILVLTDLPIFGRFRLPRNLDYVHIPSVQDLSRDAASTAASPAFDHTHAMRRRLIEAAISCFAPNLVLVDRAPYGAYLELRDTLSRLRERPVRAKTVLGLWDIPGAPDFIRPEWERTNTHEALRTLYDEVWIYGTPQVFDQVQEYAIPADIAQKMVYTGYFKHRVKQKGLFEKLSADGLDPMRPYVLVTIGGGRTGYDLLDSYLSFVQNEASAGEFQSHIVCGPLMSSESKHSLDARAQALPSVSIHRFHKDLVAYLYGASLVVSSGGYNTCCQVLSFRKKAVLVPKKNAQCDQVIRAEAFHRHGVVEMVGPDALSPETLGAKVWSQMKRGPIPRQANGFKDVPLSGLDAIVNRITQLCEQPEYRRVAAGA